MYCGKPRVKAQHLVSAMDFCLNIFSMPQDYLIYFVNQATSFDMQYKWTGGLPVTASDWPKEVFHNAVIS